MGEIVFDLAYVITQANDNNENTFCVERPKERMQRWAVRKKRRNGGHLNRCWKVWRRKQGFYTSACRHFESERLDLKVESGDD